MGEKPWGRKMERGMDGGNNVREKKERKKEGLGQQ